MHHLTSEISFLLRYVVNLIVFTLLVHLILHSSANVFCRVCNKFVVIYAVSCIVSVTVSFWLRP